MSWITELPEVHMTVGSSPKITGGRPDAQNQRAMTKAALLYADHTKLVSMMASVLMDMRTTTPDLITLLRIMANRADNLTDKVEFVKLIETYDWAQRRKHTKRGRQLLGHFNQVHAEFLHAWPQLRADAISELGGEELIDAIDQGVLEIHKFKSFFDRVSEASLSGEMVEAEYVEAISNVVSDVQTYPFFDEDTSRLICSRIESAKGGAFNTDRGRSREVMLAADLIARLPLFELATMKEILDIRRELEKPLRNFRASMIKFSDQIESASWDGDFAQDADSVFRSEVAPAILALEEEEKSNTFLNKLTAKVAEKSLQVGSAISATGAISALAVRMLNLPVADVAAMAVGPAIVAGGVAYTAYKEWREKQKEIEGNSLFFYYKAGSLLEDGSFRYKDTNNQG